jgi:lipopolysaccharide/colanic/teichoic acid biosynthesis glycosyltransferase
MAISSVSRRIQGQAQGTASTPHIPDVSEWLRQRAHHSATWPDAFQALPVPPSLQRIPASQVSLPAIRTRRACATSSHYGLIRAFDTFFRRQNTWLARSLARLSPTRGTVYTPSAAKRTLDLAVSVPAVVIVILLIALLAVVNRLLYPRRPALFLQDRVGQGDKALRIVKIRSMVPGPRSGEGQETALCTAFGRFIRRHYLDELPQLLQVLTGRLSLVGIRVLPWDVYAGLAASWSHERFATWQAMYATAPLGLTGAHQVFRARGKEDGRRFHRDMFYARHATLGFDLYLLWRTLGTTDSGHSHPIG